MNQLLTKERRVEITDTPVLDEVSHEYEEGQDHSNDLFPINPNQKHKLVYVNLRSGHQLFYDYLCSATISPED